MTFIADGDIDFCDGAGRGSEVQKGLVRSTDISQNLTGVKSFGVRSGDSCISL